MSRYVYTIQPHDVGKGRLPLDGRVTMVTDFIGRVQARDVGKRIYESGGVYQVESDQQVESRMRTKRKSNPELKDVRVVGSNMVEAHHGLLHILYSYKTPVAILAPSGLYKTAQFHSNTTSKHISKWFRAWNLDPKGAIGISQESLAKFAEDGKDPTGGTRRKNAPSERITARDVSATKNVHGYWVLSTIKDGYRVQNTYGGYSKQAAMREFLVAVNGPRKKNAPRQKSRRSPWSSRTKRYVLVYQAGIANVFKVKSFNLSDYGRDAERLYQGDFRGAEQFARGLAAAGGVVRTAAANLAGDIARATWTEDLESQPFSDKFHPVHENPVQRGGRGTFVHVRKVAPGKFVKRSLRTVKTNGKRVIVGHLKGETRRTKAGRTRLTVQATLRAKAGKRSVGRRRNPLIGILGNPPADAKYLGKVTYIEYTHGHDGKPYSHDFSPAVYAQVMDDGSVRLWHPTNKLWKLFPV